MKRVVRHCLPGVALGLLAAAQPWLERRMLTHMAVEQPLLFALGWWAGASAHGARAWLARIDPIGLTSFTAAWIITALWMLPVALDDAVLHPVVGLLKVLSLLVAGFSARSAFASSSAAVQGFFVLNWGWMTGAAGLLYQQLPDRLCSTYLQGDQTDAGLALTSIAAISVMGWMVFAFLEKKPAPGGGT